METTDATATDTPIETSSSTSIVDTTAPVVETAVAETPAVETPAAPAAVPGWDGRKETLLTLPYWSGLPADVQASILAGVDVVESRWSEATTAAETARLEREAAQAIADLLDARDTGSVDVARDMVALRNQLQSLEQTHQSAIADYESKLAAATDGHRVSQTELEELRAAKSALEAASAERDSKFTEMEAALAERDSKIAEQQKQHEDLLNDAILNHLMETRPDLRGLDEIKRLEMQSKFFDILLNPLVDGDMEKAYRYFAVEVPPPPKPDTVPDAVALMNNNSVSQATLAGVLGSGPQDPMERLLQRRRQMVDEAIHQDNM